MYNVFTFAYHPSTLDVEKPIKKQTNKQTKKSDQITNKRFNAFLHFISYKTECEYIAISFLHF